MSFASGVSKATVLDDPISVCEAAKHGGGAWLDDTALKRCLETTVRADNLAKEIANLDEMSDSLSQEVATLKAEIKQSGTALDALKKDAQESDKEDAKLEACLTAWYHNPWVTGAIGFGLGIITVTTTYAVLRN